MLAKMGFTDVVQAADGEEAFEVLRMRHVDLVLTDWVMPNLDGGALIRQIRDTPSYEDLPVVVFSALSEPENVRAAKDAGSDAFLPKPFSREQLQKKMGGPLRVVRRVRSSRSFCGLIQCAHPLLIRCSSAGGDWCKRGHGRRTGPQRSTRAVALPEVRVLRHHSHQ